MREAYDYVLMVDGVFGKSKKVRSQSYALLEGVGINYPNTLINLADEKMREIAFKSGRAKVFQFPALPKDGSVVVKRDMKMGEVVVKLFDPTYLDEKR